MLGTAVVRANRSSAGHRPIALAGDRSSRSDPPRFSSKTSSKAGFVQPTSAGATWCPPSKVAAKTGESPSVRLDNLRDRADGDRRHRSEWGSAFPVETMGLEPTPLLAKQDPDLGPPAAEE